MNLTLSQLLLRIRRYSKLMGDTSLKDPAAKFLRVYLWQVTCEILPP